MDCEDKLVKGRKRNVDGTTWLRNIQKRSRAEGESYLKTTKEGEVIVESKKFVAVTNCCPKKCYQNIPASSQKRMFNNFYDLADKCKQDECLSSFLSNKDIKSRRTHASKHVESLWKYTINVSQPNLKIVTCKQLLLKLFQVTDRRFRTIQGKIKSGCTDFKERRGTHNNRPKKIDALVWNLVEEHWETIHDKQSHNDAKTSQRLTVKRLFSMFKKYFKNKTETPLKMKYSTYFKYFRSHSPDAFPLLSSAEIKWIDSVIEKSKPEDLQSDENDNNKKEEEADSENVMEFEFPEDQKNEYVLVVVTNT